MRILRFVNTSIFLAALLPSSDIHAFEWTPEIQIPLSIEYTDNLFYDIDERVSDVYYRAAIVLALTGSGENSSLSIHGSAESQRLKTTTAANNEFYGSALQYQHYTENTQFQLDAGYAEASTRSSELESIGLINIFGKRKTTHFSPSFFVQIGYDDLLHFQLDANLIEYSGVRLINYRDYTALTSWLHTINDTNEVGFSIQLQRYDAVNSNTDYDYGATSVVWNNSVSEEIQLDIQAGIGYIIRKADDNYKTFLTSINLTKENEYSQLRFAVGSTLDPTGAGSINRTGRAELGISYSTTELTTISGDIRFSQSETVSVASPLQNQYIRADASITHTIRESTELGIRYQYMQTTRDSDPSKRYSNNIFIELTLLI